MEQERTLTDSQRDEFEDMLRALTLERSQIKEAMGFALDNADAAGEVINFSNCIESYYEPSNSFFFCPVLFCISISSIPHYFILPTRYNV